MSRIADPDSVLREHSPRVPPLISLLVAIAVVAVYPTIFFIGYRSGTWADPDGLAWAAFIVTAVLGASMTIVLVAALLSPSADPSFGRLIGSAIVFAIGLPLAAIAGLGAGLSGFSCSGGAIGEGCGGGSVVVGLLVGGAVAALTAWLARVVGHPKV